MKILHQSKDFGISEMQKWPSTLSKAVNGIDVCFFSLPGSNTPMECPENESRKGNWVYMRYSHPAPGDCSCDEKIIQ